MSQVDLIIHAGTKLALEQWLQARGLGVSFQDTDPTSPTFGDWFYTHTDRANSSFLWWKEPSGKMTATRTVDNTDPENPIITETFFNGFYGHLQYHDQAHFEATLAPWFRTSTATSILDGFNGIGGEGITLVNPDDVTAHHESIVSPMNRHQGNGIFSDPQFWYLTPVMIGDEREFDGQTYQSLIDFNVWTQRQYPEGWELVDEPEPTVDPWVQGGGTGTAGSYNLNDEVTHDNPNDGGNIWLYRSNIPANTTEPGRDGTFDRWWAPINPV